MPRARSANPCCLCTHDERPVQNAASCICCDRHQSQPAMPAQTVLEGHWLQDKLSLVCLTSPLPASGWGWLVRVKDMPHGGPKPVVLG